jgi:hypothetical protein
MAYTQDNLRQAINTREGQSHISCVPSRPNQLHPQECSHLWPLSFVVASTQIIFINVCLLCTSFVWHKENLSEPPSLRVVCLYHYLHCLDLATTTFVVHPLTLFITLFVSIRSSSHLSLSKSSCNWLCCASSHHYFIVCWQIILLK